MKSLAALDRPSWLSSSAWPWQPYLLSHHQGGIAVTDIGDGPAVLFVHVGSWSFVWRDVLLRLANDFRCVAIDAPGCGLSDRLSTPPTLAQAADAITSVIDALQLRDLTLVAHDLGDEDAELVVGDAQDHDLAWYANQELPFLLDLL